MSRRSRSLESDISGGSSPPRHSSRKRSRMDRERSRPSYSPPMRYRSPHADDYYMSSSSSRSSSFRVLSVTNIDEKVSDEMMKDALYKEFRRFGEVSVRVVHGLEERTAFLTYKSSEDASYARKNKPRIMFYNKPIVVQPVYDPSKSEVYPRPSGGYSPPYDRAVSSTYDSRSAPPPPPPSLDPFGFLPAYPYDAYRPPGPARFPPPLPGRFPPPPFMMPPGPGAPVGPPGVGLQARRMLNKKDRFPNYLQHLSPEDDPLATRTLFAGNLEVSISDEEVRRVFGRYGKLEDVDIKRPPPDTGNAYAFLRYENLDQAHQAKISLSGQYIGKFLCKIGYGKPVPTVKVFVGGLGEWCSQQLLEKEFDRFGAIKEMHYKPGAPSAGITYDSIDAAKAAVAAMRGFPLGGPMHRIRMDFLHVDGQSDPVKPPPGSRSESSSMVPPPPGEEGGGSSFDNGSARDSSSSRGGGHMAGRRPPRGGMSFPPTRPIGSYPPPPPHVYNPVGLPPPPHRPPPHPHMLPPPGSVHGLPPPIPPHHRHHPPPLPPPPSTMRAHTPPEVEYDHLPRSYRPRTQYSPPRGWSISPPPPQHHHHSRRPRSPPMAPPMSRGPERVEDLRSAIDVDRVLSKCWEGGVVLKNSIFSTKLHMVRGEHSAVRGLDVVLKIAQRLRLDPTKLEDVRRRLSMSPGHAVFIGLPSNKPAPPQSDPTIVDRPLKHLVCYLKQKDAAGVVSLQTHSGTPTGVVYAFPPCRFSHELLRVTSPHIEDEDVDDHIVVVMVAGAV